MSVYGSKSSGSFRSACRRILRIVAVVGIGFPAASYGTYQLFLYLYLPPTRLQATPIDVSRNRVIDDSNQVRDDACRECESATLQTIRLCVLSDAEAFIGHAFLRTNAYSVGFRTNERDIGLVDYLWPWAQRYPGYTLDDTDSPYDFELTYQACPETIATLRASIDAHAKDEYQVGNWGGGRNCATWAADRLRDAALIAPTGDCPNRMAQWMHPCDASNDSGREFVMSPCREASR